MKRNKGYFNMLQKVMERILRNGTTNKVWSAALTAAILFIDFKPKDTHKYILIIPHLPFYFRDCYRSFPIEQSTVRSP